MVRGPIGATVATLMDQSWAPLAPGHWVTHTGQELHLDTLYGQTKSIRNEF